MRTMIPLALAVAGANAAVAEQLPMEHVLVSVPLHKQEAETALPITVLSGDELTRAAAATLGETLDNAPGLANASFGPGVGQPVIRGQQGARVTVLQNGTATGDASNLSADHAVSVEALLADSMEILRGPSTLLYGGGAIGGVVNVVDNRIPTRPQSELSGGAEYRHDSASDMDTSVGRLDGGDGAFAFHLDGLYREWNDLDVPGRANNVADDADETTDGYIDNTGGHYYSATAGGSYHFDSGFVGLAVNHLENDYGVPAGGHGHEEADHESDVVADDDHEEGGVDIDLQQTRYDLAVHLHEPLPGLEVARGFVSYTHYAHDEIEPTGDVGTRYRNDSWQGRLEMVHQPIGELHGVFGLQFGDRDFSALGEEAFVPKTSSRDWGLFIVEDYHLNDWSFEGGLRYDHSQRDPDLPGKRDASFNTFSLSASALWDLSDSLELGLSLSRAERAPSIEELYSNVAGVDAESWIVHAATQSVELGDPDLDTEVSRNVDLSLRWDIGQHFVELTAYYNSFKDYIGLQDAGIEVEDVPVMAYSQNDATFHGVELDSRFELVALAGGELALRVFGDMTRGSFDDIAGNDDVPRLPPDRIGVGLNWEADQAEVWTRTLHAYHQDRPGAYEDPTASYTRWDAGIEYRPALLADKLTLFVTLNNITDEEIRLSTSFLREVAPEAGRSLEGGIRYQF